MSTFKNSWNILDFTVASRADTVDWHFVFCSSRKRNRGTELPNNSVDLAWLNVNSSSIISLSPRHSLDSGEEPVFHSRDCNIQWHFSDNWLTLNTAVINHTPHWCNLYRLYMKVIRGDYHAMFVLYCNTDFGLV